MSVHYLSFRFNFTVGGEAATRLCRVEAAGATAGGLMEGVLMENAEGAEGVSEGGLEAKEKPKDPEPNTPEPKAPEPKDPEPNAPEPKAPEPKDPEPKAPEPKAPDPKAPDPKAPEPKAPDPKAPDPKDPEPKGVAEVAPKENADVADVAMVLGTEKAKADEDDDTGAALTKLNGAEEEATVEVAVDMRPRFENVEEAVGKEDGGGFGGWVDNEPVDEERKI